MSDVGPSVTEVKVEKPTATATQHLEDTVATNEFSDYYLQNIHKLVVQTDECKAGGNQLREFYDEDGHKIPIIDEITYMDYTFDKNRPKRDMSIWFP